MSVNDIRKELRRIAKMDDESAHASEDELHRNVLKAIADGSNLDAPERLAAEALKSQKMTFSRWYA